MNEITPFTFEEHNVRVITDKNGSPLFVGRDICDALGYSDATTAIRSHCKGVQILHPLKTDGGTQRVRVLTESDVMRLVVSSTLPASEAFERLVFEEILPSIRKTGRYESRTNPAPAPRVFTDYFRVARLIGLDKNVAAISANQAAVSLTGTNVLSLLGQTHIETPDQTLYFTPTELGEKMGGISAQMVNNALEHHGFQDRVGGKWVPKQGRESFFRILDTGKRHGSGAMVQQVKWSDAVIYHIQEPF